MTAVYTAYILQRTSFYGVRFSISVCELSAVAPDLSAGAVNLSATGSASFVTGSASFATGSECTPNAQAKTLEISGF